MQGSVYGITDIGYMNLKHLNLENKLETNKDKKYMESYIFSNLLQECIDIPLQPNEELSIHFSKLNNTIECKVILYSKDGETILKPSHIYYDEGYIEYLLLLFQLETINLIKLTLIMDYDREQQKFVLIHVPYYYE